MTAGLPASLRGRLMLLIVAAFLPLLALSVFAGLQQWRASIENSRAEAARLAVLAGANQQRVVEGTLQVLETLARAPEIRSLNADECYGFLHSLLGDDRWFVNLGVIGVDGYLRCHSGKAQRAYLGDRSYFREALRLDAAAAGEFQVGRVTGAKSLNIGRPLRSAGGELLGVVYAALDVSVLGRIAGDVELPNGATLTVFDRNGVVLASKPADASLLGRPYPDKRVVDAARSGPAGQIEAGDGENRRLIAYAPVGGMAERSMFVAVEQREDAVVAALTASLLLFIAALAAVTAIALVLAWMTSSMLVVDPIRQIISAARKVAAGDLTARTGVADTKGDLGELARAFDSMTQALAERVSALVQAESQVAESSARYRKLFLDNPVPMWLYDQRSLRFLEVNDAATERYGYSREEFRAMTLKDIRPPEDIPALTEALATASGVRRSSAVWRHLRKDGSLIQVEIASHETLWEGHAARLVLAYDVTDRETSAAALSQLQARYRTLVELSPEPIHVHCGGKFTFLNSAAVRFFGADSEADLLGRSLYDLIVPELHADVRERVARMERGETTPRAEQRMRLLDGSVVDVEVSAAPITDGGKPAVMVVLRDISERKRAERALQRSEERFRALTELNADWYWEQDEQFRFIDLAQGGGTAAVIQEYLGKTRWDLPYNRASEDAWARHRAALEAHESFTDFEMTRVDEEGQVVGYISVSGYPIFDERGRFSGYRGVGKDVTQSKRAQLALEDSENRYRTLVDLSPDPIYLHRDGIFRFLNQAALDFFRAASAEDLVGRDSLDFVTPPYRERSLERVGRMMAGGREPRIELQFRVLDGELRDAELSATSIVESGERKIMVVLRDITERKLAERELQLLNENLERRVRDRTAQLEASNRELEAFAYSVSHDLRAPLRTIDGFSAALVEDYGPSLDEQAHDYLRRIRSGTVRMGELIEDLLALSRVSTAELRRQRVDVSRLAQVIVEDLQAGDDSRQVEVRVAGALAAQGDPGLLRVLMQNLLDNAWKFTRGRASACIEIGGQVRDGEQVFFVRDNGVGFDMAYSGKLFGVFQRLHAQKDFEGSGVGLATAQRIVRRHGGRIWAEAEPDKGAVFYFTLG
jgi:PAS domain S-box-containing protein